MERRVLSLLIALCMMLSVTVLWVSATNEDDNSYADIENFFHSYENNLYVSSHEGHYPACDTCGYYNELNLQPHFSEDGDDLCDLCYYKISISGDMDGNQSVDNNDVAYLLWHTLFPEDYPVSPELGDLDSNGVIDNLDVEYLLWHTLFPEDYPI